MSYGLQIFDALGGSVFDSERFVPAVGFSAVTSTPGTISIPGYDFYYICVPNSGFTNVRTSLPGGMFPSAMTSSAITLKAAVCAQYLATANPVTTKIIGVAGGVGKGVPAPTGNYGLSIKDSAGNYVFNTDLTCLQTCEDSATTVTLSACDFGRVGAIYYAHEYDQSPLIFIHGSSFSNSSSAPIGFWHHIVNAAGKFIGFTFLTPATGNVYVKYRVVGKPVTTEGFGLACYNPSGLSWSSGLGMPVLNIGTTFSGPWGSATTPVCTVTPAYPNDNKWALLNMYNPAMTDFFYLNFKGSGYITFYSLGMFYNGGKGWEPYYWISRKTGFIFPEVYADGPSVTGSPNGGYFVVTMP